jgi:hypothetical protein
MSSSWIVHNALHVGDIHSVRSVSIASTRNESWSDTRLGSTALPFNPKTENLSCCGNQIEVVVNLAYIGDVTAADVCNAPSSLLCSLLT